MAKYYVESGPVKMVISAASELEAAMKTFQWTCDRQAEIGAETPVGHAREAERLGIQMHDIVWVNQRGFGRRNDWYCPTLEVVNAWMEGGPLPRTPHKCR
jgi:hypothetical protein